MRERERFMGDKHNKVVAWTYQNRRDNHGSRMIDLTMLVCLCVCVRVCLHR